MDGEAERKKESEKNILIKQKLPTKFASAQKPDASAFVWQIWLHTHGKSIKGKQSDHIREGDLQRRK